MNTQTYIEFIPKFITKLENDGISSDIMKVSKWITNYFKDYCLENNIEFVDLEVIHKFYQNRFGYNINEANCNVQFVIRRPLLILIEYYETGTYLKSHYKNKELLVPASYIKLFCDLKKYVNELMIGKKEKNRKITTILNFLIYLDSINIKNIKELTINNVSEYIESINNDYATETIRTIKGILRTILNKLYYEKKINFSGHQVFPIIRRKENKKMLTTYTTEEITRMLNSVDNSTKNGKCKYAILCLLVYYGLRAGDIRNLKFENIDFEKNCIKLVQQKTNNQLFLPLIDEVKIPLLDYIKNGRRESEDKEYIFITMKAPYTKFSSSASMHTMVTNTMKEAKVNFENKKHGPHSLRHSLATNMINENIPLEDISSILGHESTNTTNVYISKDTTHLRELTLEVS